MKTKKTDGKVSFWQTLPGILTALAALITAVAGLAAALSASGIFHTLPRETPTAIASVPITGGTAPAESATALPTEIPAPPMEVGSTYPYADGSLLVAIPAGTFTMGNGDPGAPVHKVTLRDFWIYRTKVTNQQYQSCVNSGQCTAPNAQDDPQLTNAASANDPVVGVTYDQAAAYCKSVHGRLPTEAEWEKAARGPNGNVYPWGDSAPSCDLLNFGGCLGQTSNVTAYPRGKSYFSVLDMAGNVYEWVADWYDPLYYGSSALEDPLGPTSGQMHSVRSTSFKSIASQVAPAIRSFDLPADHRPDLGFRCVVDDATYFAPYCQRPPAPAETAAAALGCPTVSINVQPQSCKNQDTLVTFKDTGPGQIQGMNRCRLVSGGSGFPQVYDCKQETVASIQGVCNVTQLQCAAGYQLNPLTNVCEWMGSHALGSTCPSGYGFDQAKQCCTAQPVSASAYSICAAGSYLVKIQAPNHPGTSQYACVTQTLVTASSAYQAVTLPGACQKRQPDNLTVNSASAPPASSCLPPDLAACKAGQKLGPEYCPCP